MSSILNTVYKIGSRLTTTANAPPAGEQGPEMNAVMVNSNGQALAKELKDTKLQTTSGKGALEANAKPKSWKTEVLLKMFKDLCSMMWIYNYDRLFLIGGLSQYDIL